MAQRTVAKEKRRSKRVMALLWGRPPTIWQTLNLRHLRKLKPRTFCTGWKIIHILADNCQIGIANYSKLSFEGPALFWDARWIGYSN